MLDLSDYVDTVKVCKTLENEYKEALGDITTLYDMIEYLDENGFSLYKEDFYNEEDYYKLREELEDDDIEIELDSYKFDRLDEEHEYTIYIDNKNDVEYYDVEYYDGANYGTCVYFSAAMGYDETGLSDDGFELEIFFDIVDEEYWKEQYKEYKDISFSEFLNIKNVLVEIEIKGTSVNEHRFNY